MYHSLLVHLSADGHLGCFHVLAIINSAVMNIGVHMSLSDLVSLVGMPRSGLVGHMAVLFPVFKEISTLFSIVAVLVFIPTKYDILKPTSFKIPLLHNIYKTLFALIMLYHFFSSGCYRCKYFSCFN